MFLHSRWFPLLLFLIVALAIRAQTFGAPLLHMDENFYLLMGERMIQDGAWPYVDIWDRKPVGLFLLYAGFAASGLDPFWVYQMAAMIAVVGTAWLVYAITAMVVERRYALMSGCIYIAYLTFFGGYGGQAPVFYNILVAFAAWMTTQMAAAEDGRAVAGEASYGWPQRKYFSAGMLAMLAMGLALQIKYSVVFEGVFFGLIALWGLRTTSLHRFVLSGTIWALTALTPTILVWAVYAMAGYNHDFVYANFLSILDRESDFDAMAAQRLAALGGLLSVLLVMALYAFTVKTNRTGRIIKAWAVTAVVAVLLFGTFYNHYGLPLVLPLSVMAGIAMSGLGARLPILRRCGPVVVATLCVVAGSAATYIKTERKGDEAHVVEILRYLPSGRTGLQTASCPWFTGTTAATLYIRSNACLPTAYPLSGHLFETHERYAIGIDPSQEIARIQATLPPVVTIDEIPRPEEDAQLRKAFLGWLEREYTLRTVIRMGKNAVRVYVRH